MATPTYVLMLPLKTELWQSHVLEKRLEIARKIYNACLGEAWRRYKYMIRQPEYWKAIRMEKGRGRNKRFHQLRKDYDVEKFSLNMYVQDMGRKFKKNMGSQMVQNIAERAFSAVEKVMYGKGKKVYFRPKGKFFTVEEKTNQTGFRYFRERNTVEWLGLVMPVILKAKDEYAHQALNDRIKYCRLNKKVIRGQNRYFVQIVLEGFPPRKKNRMDSDDKNARVGLDIGTSTLAYASAQTVGLVELAEGIGVDETEKRILQRKLDRMRRANNLDKYNEDGTIKKGNKEKWVQSNNYIKARKQLAEIQRKISEKREQSHNRLANHLLSLGLDIRVEQMNYQGLQRKAKETTVNEKTGKINRKKRFGKSIASRAPAKLIAIIDRKLHPYGLTVKKIDTVKVKASQFNHFTQTYVKKPLSNRWNHFEQGNVQRDLYSAFLIMNTKDNLQEIDVERANKTWERFFELHEQEMKRIKYLDKKHLSSIGL